MPTALDLALAALRPGGPLGRPHRHLTATASTNAVAKAWAQEGAPHGAMVTADHQTAGRGRLGRTWTDEPGASLLVSLVLRPTVAPERWGWLGLAAALALARALDGFGAAAQVKWPNDVLLSGKKVAGVLAEGVHGARPAVVLGMGVNVHQTAFPDAIAERATSLRLALGAPTRRAPLLARWLDALAPLLDALRDRDRALREAFEARLFGRGEAVTVHAASGAGRERGVLLGVAADGGLRLGTDAGERVFHAGEVTLSAAASRP